jgi:SAM-dependent methyltransferase
MTFAGRRPSDAELAAHYENYGEAWYDSPITRQRYGELLDSFEPYRRLNRILDVGCGAGFFLEEAQRRGWEARGTEFGAHALELNRAKGLEVVAAPISRATFPRASFDVVTAFEVVEHVRDPRAEAELLRHLVRPGGLFYCTTPNFNALTRHLLKERWRVIGYPEHLCYFTRRSLRNWLEGFGFMSVGVVAEGLSPAALRFAVATDGADAPVVGSDEEIRVAVEGSSALRLLKRVANDALSVAGAGDTLKGRFELPVGAAGWSAGRPTG